MRVLLLAKAKFFLPPDYLPMAAQGFIEWRAKYRDKMDEFFFFAGRQAGGGIFTVNDEAELNQIVNEWPLAPFAETDIIPLVDGDVALKQFSELAQMVSGQMGGGS
jgi:muconolactone delta-isomerase